MLWIKRVLALLAMLSVAALTLVFILENQGLARLQFLSLQSPQLPVAFLVVLAFAAGGVCALLLSLYAQARLRLSLARSHRELAGLRQQLATLQAARDDQGTPPAA